MLLSVTQSYGISKFKVVLVTLELIAVFIYTPKKFLVDLEFLTRSNITWCTKVRLFIVLPLGLVVIHFEMWTTMDLLTDDGAELPGWAIGIQIFICKEECVVNRRTKNCKRLYHFINNITNISLSNLP